MITSCIRLNNLHVKQIESIELNRVVKVTVVAIRPPRHSKEVYSLLNRAHRGNISSYDDRKRLSMVASIFISKNSISFIKLIYVIVPTNSKKSNLGFTEIWHCFHIPKGTLTGHDTDVKRHDECTNFSECANEHSMNGSHLLPQYHKSSFGIRRNRANLFDLPKQIVLAPYVWCSM